MRRFLALLLGICILFCGCAGQKPDVYNTVYLNLFDTVTTVMGTASSREAFLLQANQIYNKLLYYHQLFDIYNSYEGIVNLKTVNDRAGIAPVVVDSAIIQLMLDCKEYYTLTGGKVNAAMGSVLQLWHEAREQGLNNPDNAKLPDADALALAAQHTDFDSVIIDEAASTVYICDPELSIDVGAIAKGWAAQRVAEAAPEGMLISVGGNVCATGAKLPDGTPWVVGIQNPDGSGNHLHTIRLSGGAVVTSGDYQRTYTVDGKAYHHIIDPATQMPSEYWQSVTVICADSALADALSTALFLLPLAEGQTLAKQCSAEVFWLDKENNESCTDGFRTLLQE